jgi:hypothetical protein
MKAQDTIDYAKLLGFAMVSDLVGHEIDLQDDTVGDKLGAKIGGEATDVPAEPAKQGAK